MRWILGYIAAFCALAVIVCTSVSIPTFFKPFYKYEYSKRQIPESINVDSEELLAVTGELLGYMRGKRDDLTVPAVVAGEEREFFNQREKEHMRDVRALFDIGFTVRNLAFWLFMLILLVMAWLKIRIPYVLSRCCREVLAGFLIISAIIVVLIALDFDRAFTVFHLIFFSNDLWQLNPATDLLVNIVPIGFFTDIALFIAGLLLAFSAAVITASTLYLSHVSLKERYPEHG